MRVPSTRLALPILALAATASAVCPFMSGESGGHPEIHKREAGAQALPGDDGFLTQFERSDEDVYMTSDTGVPIDDRTSLKAGERGPTLLEDFIIREKLTAFDHERIPERPGMFSLL
jgi:catalase